MERKIGEIFEYNGEWYQCLEEKTCTCFGCNFRDYNCDDISLKEVKGSCQSDVRSDGISVIFKKLEKVGEPYVLEDKKFQKYKVFKTPYIYHKIDCSWQSFSDPYYISLEIKEDMEEKKLNLKPFDIQKAREGKPVCTRDGHKARIICFDKQEGFPIIALVETKVNDRISEEIALFNINGRAVSDDIDSKLDLMMLPEKKEGWVNIDKGGSGKITISSPYSTKEEAIHNDNETTIDTIKISWEE